MSGNDASYGTLRDFDWSMRMVLSSDRLSGLGKPLLQLKLDTTTSAEGVVKEHLVEMDLQELDRLLNGLESAQAAAQR
ncbi:hypothetical protein B484DRAFT_457631 [Ochromonadaceae sp. CCMP2298]|nr:hypothetical protein B484DRAFT_457631 [Ochromonadaceae sp. CCMP2298]